MNINQYFNKNTISLVNITDKHNGLINTACTAEPGKICSIINDIGSGLLNNTHLSWTAGIDPIRNTIQFASICSNENLNNTGIGIIRFTDGSSGYTDSFYGCSSQKQGLHIWTEISTNINTALWVSTTIF